MKALLVGGTANIQNAISMSKGFEQLGMEHGYFGYVNFFRKYGQEKLKTTLLDLISTHKPDWSLVQYQHNPYIKPEWFKEIKEINPTGKISLMSVDMRNDIDQITITAGKYADVCFQKGRKKKYLEHGLNCHILQQGYSDLLFYKKDLPKIYDLVFAGNFYPMAQFPATSERIDILSYLSNKFQNMKVYGSSWEPVLPQRVLGGMVKLSKINDIYNYSKIILNINHYNDIEHYWSIRMIEGMASGSFMLTRYVPGLENYFTNHKNIVWFYTLGDCIDLINYYLENDAEREEIAKNSLNFVQENYKWEVIMKKAYEIVFGAK